METKFMRLEDLTELESQLRKQLNDVADKVKAAKDEKRSMELEALKPLAIKAHDILCPYNHTDDYRCGWGYEESSGEHNWTGKYSSHASWLERVEKWLEPVRYGQRLTPEKLDKLLDHIAEGKAIYPDYVFMIHTVFTRD